MITEKIRRLKYRYRLARAKAELAARSTVGVEHRLPGQLIVSLTSYPARFGTLGLTLNGLLRQSVKADQIILWLDEEDVKKIPRGIADIPELQISICPPWRSYKKIVPTLLENPDAFIVTADDDIHYPHDWLAGLVSAVAGGAKVACYRAHRVILYNNAPAPYKNWQHNIAHVDRSRLVFLTGVSGAIYAPGALHVDTTRADLFTTLAPSSDDVWLYWMYRLNGVEVQKIGSRARILEWEGSQSRSLRDENAHGDGNDRAIAALMERYGWPG